jgi:hypothetical protein
MWPFKKKQIKKLKFSIGETVVCLRTQQDCEIKNVYPDSKRPYYVSDLRGTGFIDEEYCLQKYSPDLKVYQLQFVKDWYDGKGGGTYTLYFGGKTKQEAIANLADQLIERGLAFLTEEKPLRISNCSKNRFKV